ncbi:MAG: M48 family metallopeptidase [Desulforhabdus sp.]|nr:M48 family metallopeptidase [Desulforhabdus sp.]
MIQVNILLVGFVSVFLFQTCFQFCLERLNIRYLLQQGNHVPPAFIGVVDGAKLAEINAYTASRSRMHTVRSLVADGVLLLLILSGSMPALASFLNKSVPHLVAGLLFFLVPGVILYLVDLPFDYYETFIIEQEFGFNRATRKIWTTDHLKSGSISVGISSTLLLLIFWTIAVSPVYWWLWTFLLVSLVQITLAILYPIMIAPVFNKFIPLENESLADKIMHLMEENDIRVKRILQMDAGLRSRHTNAYFTGLGKTKQIVLFDTLLQSHPSEEILAVLAHEAGHYKKSHILKQLLLFEIAFLVGFILTYHLMNWPLLYSTFGFESSNPYIGLFFIAIFWQKSGFFFRPLYLTLSRRFERQADSFAAKMMKDPQPLAAAFKRMATDNLANLNPHPLYVKFHYSHPPLAERVKNMENNNFGDGSSLPLREAK